MSTDTATAKWLQQALALRPAETAFPWQEELLARFIDGEVVRSLDVPTGLGKTSVMAIWLVARGCGAPLPRRLVYVVDRRAVVDQATDVAVGLRQLVDCDPALKRALGLAKDQALPISTLRGQHVDNREWLEDPAAPAIIVGTVDMVGSRLLFEGYGTTRKMRPYHAGLLGADTLLVLDESHLVPPFELLLATIAADAGLFGPSDEALRGVVPQFKLLALSATGRANDGESLGLTQKDLKHREVARRLGAIKRLSFVKLQDGEKLPQAIVEQAWQLTDQGRLTARCILFCNRRGDAEAVKAQLEGRAEVELFVGGRRVMERQQAARRLAELGFIAGDSEPQQGPAFVVATSAAEVGVDLDADHMVCDLVAWERMVQRMGRVNRRGRGDASVIVVREPKPQPTKAQGEALETDEPARTKGQKAAVLKYRAAVERWEAYAKPFEFLPAHDDGSHNASPGALRDLKNRCAGDAALGRVLESATTPAPLRPALSRALVDAWSMTSLKRHTGRPEVGPWLRGWVDVPPQTVVVWRRYLPVRRTARVVEAKEVEAFFEAAPPHASERLEAETYRVLDWLAARAKAALSTASADDEGALQRADVVAFALSSAGDLRHSLTLQELLPPKDTKKDRPRWKKALEAVLVGATVIVDSRMGGLSDGLLDAKRTASPRTADDGQPWMPVPQPVDNADAPAPVVRFRIRAVETGQPAPTDRPWWERARFADAESEDGEALGWLLIEKWRHDAATEEDRSAGRPQHLDEHQAWTEERARSLAERLGLPDEHAKMLAIAARLHDEGKRAKRWQRAFNAPRDADYAKTCGPMNTARLDGYRHELGSLPVAAQDAAFQRLPMDLQELALHLVAAHHGFARPVISTKGCDDALPAAIEERARQVALRFARLQKRWGPWGLAWWEALLRAADQQASRANDVADRTSAEEGA